MMLTLKELIMTPQNFLIWRSVNWKVYEDDYDGAKLEIEKLFGTNFFGFYSVSLLYAYILYGVEDFESSFKQFRTALTSVKSSKLNKHEKNYLIHGTKPYIEFLEHKLGVKFSNEGLEFETYDISKVRKVLKRKFPLSD